MKRLGRLMVGLALCVASAAWAVFVLQWGGVQLPSGRFASVYVTERYVSVRSPEGTFWGGVSGQRVIESGVELTVSGGVVDVYAPTPDAPKGSVAWSVRGWQVGRTPLVSGATTLR